MKIIANACQAAVLAALVAAPAFADRDGVAEPGVDLNRAFGGDAPALEQLDAITMEETRGRLPLLAIPLAIAGVDIGLMGLYWGIYVPSYGGGGGCTSCSNAIQAH
ncbi:MAG: hypothetical protein RIC38_02085 [Chromatocurvus sp.]